MPGQCGRDLIAERTVGLGHLCERVNCVYIILQDIEAKRDDDNCLKDCTTLQLG